MAVKIENLVKRYGNHIVLDHFSMEAQNGEIFGVFGTNGAGKTTMMDCLMGVSSYDKGSIMIDEEQLTSKNLKLKRILGFVPQEISIFYELTVYENLDYFCSLYVSDKKTRKAYVGAAIELLHLERIQNYYPKNLSFSELHKLNFGCGIVHNPKVLFVDELFIGVDTETKEILLKSVKKLNEQGMTIIYASNNLEELANLCSRFVILFQGKALITASLEEMNAFVGEEEKVVIEVYRMSLAIIEEIEKMAGVTYVNCIRNQLTIKSKKGKNILPRILHFLEEKEVPFGSIYSQAPTLKDAYYKLTGEGL